jgi:hypothetical protein
MNRCAVAMFTSVAGTGNRWLAIKQSLRSVPVCGSSLGNDSTMTSSLMLTLTRILSHRRTTIATPEYRDDYD